jgi:hypothetical protein
MGVVSMTVEQMTPADHKFVPEMMCLECSPEAGCQCACCVDEDADHCPECVTCGPKNRTGTDYCLVCGKLEVVVL